MSSTILGIIASSGGAAASTSSYESIATVNGNGSNTSLSLTSIPSTYSSLQLRFVSRDANNSQMWIRFNSDTGSNYSWHYLRGNGTAASATGGASATSIQYNGWNNGTATTVAAGIVDILDYASTSKYKTTRSFMGYDQNGAGFVYLSSGLWQSTSAITSITLVNGDSVAFSSDTQIALYGIKGA
jgi:hypothetical protein